MDESLMIVIEERGSAARLQNFESTSVAEHPLEYNNKLGQVKRCKEAVRLMFS